MVTMMIMMLMKSGNEGLADVQNFGKENNNFIMTTTTTTTTSSNDPSHVTSNNVQLFLDIMLIVLNVWNLFNFICIISPIDAQYKKDLVYLRHNIYDRLYSVLPYHLQFGILIFIIALSFEQQKQRSLFIWWYTLFGTIIFHKLSKDLIQYGPDYILKHELDAERKRMVNLKPPSKWILGFIFSLFHQLIPCDVTGLENIQYNGDDDDNTKNNDIENDTTTTPCSTKQPAMFVGNHTLFGIDMGPLVNTIYQEKNILLRGLSDEIHFGTPHGPLFKWIGAISGSRDNTNILMKNKHNILVYPGGQREVLKTKSMVKYSTVWKERRGFARLAIKYGYPIIPVASVGPEDIFNILYDIPIPNILKGAPKSIPLCYPISPFDLQKQYFWFGEPIQTKQYQGDWENDDYVREVRDKAKVALEYGIEVLQKKQQDDPERYLTQQIYSKIRRNIIGMREKNNNNDKEKKEN